MACTRRNDKTKFLTFLFCCNFLPLPISNETLLSVSCHCEQRIPFLLEWFNSWKINKYKVQLHISNEMSIPPCTTCNCDSSSITEYLSVYYSTLIFCNLPITTPLTPLTMLTAGNTPHSTPSLWLFSRSAPSSLTSYFEPLIIRVWMNFSCWSKLYPNQKSTKIIFPTHTTQSTLSALYYRRQ